MLKKSKIYSLIIAGAFAIGASSCNKFLEELPSKSAAIPIEDVAQIEAMLDRYASFYGEINRGAAFGTDDHGLPMALYQAQPLFLAPFYSLQYILWDTDDLPANTNDAFWSTEYQKVFIANMAIKYLNENSIGATAEQKKTLLADAHLIRAYSFFQLAQQYCLPYSEATKNELGIPLRLTTSFEESVARATLEQTYQQIEADLQEALKTQQALVMDNGRLRSWRANIAGANGFAARYYLALGDYTKALNHANTALQHHSTLVDYNNSSEMYYGADQVVTIDIGTPQQQNFTVKFPFTYSANVGTMLDWKENMYFRTLNNPDIRWFIPSDELLALYDKDHDLRYEYHIVEGYSFARAGVNKSEYNMPGYVFFLNDQILSGPTTAEMLLIKAECLARDNKVAEALTAVNTLRAARMKPGSWVNLTAANKEEALVKILDERRRELPFTHRWYDVRRYNTNDDPSDDVNQMSKTFFPYNASAILGNEPMKTYTLTKGSRRFAQPIPNAEIQSSMGVIQQNTY